MSRPCFGVSITCALGLREMARDVGGLEEPERTQKGMSPTPYGDFHGIYLHPLSQSSNVRKVRIIFQICLNLPLCCEKMAGPGEFRMILGLT